MVDIFVIKGHVVMAMSHLRKIFIPFARYYGRVSIIAA